ncbi:MAG: hypothetical protein KAR56_04780 [Thermoplasmata archaeon]|nr:hypothetical protein [Thermoplasmata archaeon]
MIRDDGQTALVDSILFMILMLLASGIILGSAGSRIQNDNGLHQYANDFADTLLVMEISDGQGDRPISDILCEQAILSDQSNFTITNGAILDSGDLLIRPGLTYAISYQDILLSSHIDSVEELPIQRQASQREYLIQDVQITITVYVWVMS